MKLVKLHVLGAIGADGRFARRTFVIREDVYGDVDILEAGRPRCEADRSVSFATFDDALIIEVERFAE